MNIPTDIYVVKIKGVMMHNMPLTQGFFNAK
jgi:hypothetical protein